tara:strand:- start:119 stop:844 length:726 start_codon:yes stop_codon:yes gene_type:complete
MKKINIIGFGKMGMQISSLLMIMGYKVNIFTKNFSLKEKKFKISNKIFEKFFKIKQSGNYEVFENIKNLPKDHTIETLSEDLTIKKNILSKLDYDFDNKFLFTNTSSYDPKEINKNAYGIHFFNPIHQIKIIETTCSKSIINNDAKFFFDDLKKLNFKIFIVKNNRGYVYNFLYFKKIALCYELIEKFGYKSEEIIEILNAFKTNNNFEEIINLVGKDTSKKIIKNLLENERNIFNKTEDI